MVKQRDMLKARFVVIVCMTALASFSMACSTTNPDEEVDLALSNDAPDAGAETERLTAEAASAESDYSSTAPAADGQNTELVAAPGDAVTTPASAEPAATDAVPAPAGESGAMPTNDPFLAGQQSAQIEQSGSETAAAAASAASDESAPAAVDAETSDSAAAESTTDATVTDGSADVSAPSEVVAATEELATDVPAEPAVLDAVPPSPDLATAGSASESPQTAAAEDPYLQDAAVATSEPEAGSPADAAAVASATIDPYAGVTDPFAQAAPPSDPEVTEPDAVAPTRDAARVPVRKASRMVKATSEPTSESLSYLVAPGDTLSEIAERIYGSVREWRTVAQANGLEAPHRIYPGDVLSIPTFGAAAAFAQAYNNAPETTVTVQRGDTLFSISQRLLGDGSAWKYIWKINEADIPNPDRLTPGQTIRFRDFRGIQAGM